MVKITVRNESGKRASHSLLKRGLECVMAFHGAPSGSLDVLITTSDAMRALNKAHRGVNKATDVLTFPGPDWNGAPLGDIAVSIEFAESGARMRGVTVSEELAYLVIHGGLHLVGFDDQSESDRATMVAEMNRVAAAVGLKPDEEWSSQPH